jgi:hypothetical protein
MVFTPVLYVSSSQWFGCPAGTKYPVYKQSVTFKHNTHTADPIGYAM